MRLIDADAYAEHLEKSIAKAIAERDSVNIENFLIALAITEAIIIDMRDNKITPTVNGWGWMERNQYRILQAGKEGQELEYRIGGRLFAIREKAQ